jgi:hypothetical protein
LDTFLAIVSQNHLVTLPACLPACLPHTAIGNTRLPALVSNLVINYLKDTAIK